MTDTPVPISLSVCVCQESSLIQRVMTTLQSAVMCGCAYHPDIWLTFLHFLNKHQMRDKGNVGCVGG